MFFKGRDADIMTAAFQEFSAKNLKQAAKSMNFLTENKIEYYSELESKIADIMTAHDAAARALRIEGFFSLFSFFAENS